MIGQRFIFHQRTQKPGELINQFLMELRRLARTYEFRKFLEEALRDRLVCGLNNNSIQKKLLSEKDLTLQRAVDIAMAAEMAVLQPTEQLTPQNEPEVMAVQQCANVVGNKDIPKESVDCECVSVLDVEKKGPCRHCAKDSQPSTTAQKTTSCHQ